MRHRPVIRPMTSPTKPETKEIQIVTHSPWVSGPTRHSKLTPTVSFSATVAPTATWACSTVTVTGGPLPSGVMTMRLTPPSDVIALT